MADYKKPNSSFLNSNRLFTNFIPKTLTETESSIMSPTSILDFKPHSSLKTKQEIKNLWPARPLSLGLIEALTDDQPGPNSSNPGSPTVLFGSQLKIQIPPLPLPLPLPLPPSVLESPKSTSDFGIKTHAGPFSPPNLRNSGPVSSLSEMELSEDYTRVISYGPNPKTTHIFDDCVVESCCGVVRFSESKKDDNFVSKSMENYDPCDGFLSCCCGCRKNLEQGCDIYMYRGEKAFCSDECRCKEMIMEEEEEWMKA